MYQTPVTMKAARKLHRRSAYHTPFREWLRAQRTGRGVFRGAPAIGKLARLLGAR